MAYETNRGPDVIQSVLQPAPELGVDRWCQALPTLTGRTAVLREVRHSDSASLFPQLSTDEVTRFLIPPPPSIEGFDRFIGWALDQRVAGLGATFAITLAGCDEAIGLIQIRNLPVGTRTAEWGFAIGSSFWGTGIFEDAARLALAFAFDRMDIHRLEARTAVSNGRGNGVLLKLGAVLEGTLRGSFVRDGQHVDQTIYSILASDWRPLQRRAVTGLVH